jgi:hypothetical protein
VVYRENTTILPVFYRGVTVRITVCVERSVYGPVLFDLGSRNGHVPQIDLDAET